MITKLLKLAALLAVLLIAGGAYLYFLAPETAYDWGLAAERRIAGLEVERATVDGLEIVYLEGGEGEPVVLLHGFGGDKDNWVRVARSLTDDYRVIAPDLPGFGESGRPENGNYGIWTQAERVHAFADTLGLERFHLGGNSMGGAIAGAYAGVHPDRLASLWLLAPAGVAGAEPSELTERIRESGENPLLPDTIDEFHALLDWAFTDQPYIPGPVKQVLARRAVERHEHYRRIFEQLRTELEGAFALEEIIAEVDVPVLVTWGENDRLLHVSGARVLAESDAEDVQVERMPGVGHVPMMERPEESAAAFRAFAAGLP